MTPIPEQQMSAGFHLSMSSDWELASTAWRCGTL